MNEKITNNMNKYNQVYGIYACKNEKATRLKKEIADVRPPFFRDIDRIIYSFYYSKYIDKTQVYSFVKDIIITKRSMHVQLVSKIARTIGRALNLNEDLIEAAALGHDLGHTPLGHIGESILNEISLKNNEGYFNHNVQSVRILMELDNNGEGRNICLQTLDAIMCHNGEIIEGVCHYNKDKTLDDFLNEYHSSYQDKDCLEKLKPMTLEGCVVRVSDFIAYLGRDYEDALRLDKIGAIKLPLKILKVLGKTNSSIIDTVVMDVIKNSMSHDYITFSNEVYEALQELKKYNYQEIYSKANNLEDIDKYRLMFNTLFDNYLSSIEKNDQDSPIIKEFVNKMNDNYLKNNSWTRIVIDYLASMTDDELLDQYQLIKAGN